MTAASSKRNANVVESLESVLRTGNHALNAAPDLMCRTIEEDCWKHFVTKRGEIVEHDSFEEFLTTLPLKGLGISVENARRLIEHDPRALKAFSDTLGAIPDQSEDAPPVERHATSQTDKALERLLQLDPQLHDEVKTGARSVNSALVAAGLRTRTFTVKVGDPNAAARALRKHLTPEQIEDVRRLLAD